MELAAEECQPADDEQQAGSGDARHGENAAAEHQDEPDDDSSDANGRLQHQEPSLPVRHPPSTSRVGSPEARVHAFVNTLRRCANLDILTRIAERTRHA